MEQRNRTFLVTWLIIASGLVFLCCPAVIAAQAPFQVPGSPPPIEAQFVRQSDFAAALAYILRITNGQDELQAQADLTRIGIAPRNGWISDSPVTPDVVADIQAATGNAAAAGLLRLPPNEALRRFARVVEESGIALSPWVGDAASYPSAAPMVYPYETDQSDYYLYQGPPVITYYEPPSAYYPLYSWVPSPFWFGGTAFGGYYILKDHHGYRHHRRTSSHWQGGRGGTRQHNPVDRSYRFGGRQETGYNNSTRPIGSGQWRQEKPGKAHNTANFRGNAISTGSQTQQTPRLSGRTGHGREMLHNPPASRPPIFTNGRFSSARTSHPSAPPAGSHGIHQGNSLGRNPHPSATAGWSRDGSGGHGYSGRGYVAFRR